MISIQSGATGAYWWGDRNTTLAFRFKKKGYQGTPLRHSTASADTNTSLAASQRLSLAQPASDHTHSLRLRSFLQNYRVQTPRYHPPRWETRIHVFLFPTPQVYESRIPSGYVRHEYIHRQGEFVIHCSNIDCARLGISIYLSIYIHISISIYRYIYIYIYINVY